MNSGYVVPISPDHESPVRVFLSLLIGGTLLYTLLGALRYWVFFVWKRRKFNPNYRAVTQTLIYWIHRGLHRSPFHEKLHYKHHEFVRPTSLSSLSFHPVDSFAQALPHHLCAGH